MQKYVIWTNSITEKFTKFVINSPMGDDSLLVHNTYEEALNELKSRDLTALATVKLCELSEEKGVFTDKNMVQTAYLVYKAVPIEFLNQN